MPQLVNIRAFLGAVILSAPLLAPGNGAAAPFSYFGSLKEAESAIGSLEIYARIAQLTPAERESLMMQQGSALQRLGTRRSLVGDASGAVQAFSWFFALTPPRPATAEELQTLAQAHADDALDSIVEQARHHQVVILNEAHHMPHHRLFAQKLAHRLRQLGFEYLACETFDEKEQAALQKKITITSGYYSREPVYGNFLREAKREGWKLVSYEHEVPDDIESEDEAMRLRELGQADNLMQRIFAKHPQARVFIYVGYAHAWEVPAFTDASQHVWLAAHLKHRLGTDPLTIDQSRMNAYPDRIAEDPLYRAALERFPRSEAFVLSSADGKPATFGRARGKVDMQVFHPDDYALGATGRPVWLESKAGLTAHEVPASLLPKKGRRLVKAYFRDEGSDAVPADMVVVESGKPPPKLMLPPGQFRYAFED